MSRETKALGGSFYSLSGSFFSQKLLFGLLGPVLGPLSFKLAKPQINSTKIKGWPTFSRDYSIYDEND